MSRLTPYHGSPLGVAECSDCGDQYPVTLAAWGNATHWSRCVKCDGRVYWSPVDDDGRELVPT